MKKRLLSFVLALAMVMSLFTGMAVTASAAETYVVDRVSFAQDDPNYDELTIYLSTPAAGHNWYYMAYTAADGVEYLAEVQETAVGALELPDGAEPVPTWPGGYYLNFYSGEDTFFIFEVNEDDDTIKSVKYFEFRKPITTIPLEVQVATPAAIKLGEALPDVETAVGIDLNTDEITISDIKWVYWDLNEYTTVWDEHPANGTAITNRKYGVQFTVEPAVADDGVNYYFTEDVVFTNEPSSKDEDWGSYEVIYDFGTYSEITGKIVEYKDITLNKGNSGYSGKYVSFDNTPSNFDEDFMYVFNAGQELYNKIIASEYGKVFAPAEAAGFSDSTIYYANDYDNVLLLEVAKNEDYQSAADRYFVKGAAYFVLRESVDTVAVNLTPIANPAFYIDEYYYYSVADDYLDSELVASPNSVAADPYYWVYRTKEGTEWTRIENTDHVFSDEYVYGIEIILDLDENRDQEPNVERYFGKREETAVVPSVGTVKEVTYDADYEDLHVIVDLGIVPTAEPFVDTVHVDITIPDLTIPAGEASPSLEGVVASSTTTAAQFAEGFVGWAVKVIEEAGFSAEDVEMYEEDCGGWAFVNWLDDYDADPDHTYAVVVGFEKLQDGLGFGPDGEYQGVITGDQPDFAYSYGDFMYLYYIVEPTITESPEPDEPTYSGTQVTNINVILGEDDLPQFTVGGTIGEEIELDVLTTPETNGAVEAVGIPGVMLSADNFREALESEFFEMAAEVLGHTPSYTESLDVINQIAESEGLEGMDPRLTAIIMNGLNADYQLKADDQIGMVIMVYVPNGYELAQNGTIALNGNAVEDLFVGPSSEIFLFGHVLGNPQPGGTTPNTPTDGTIVELTNLASITGNTLTLNLEGGYYLGDGGSSSDPITAEMIAGLRAQFLSGIGSNIVDLSDNSITADDIDNYMYKTVVATNGGLMTQNIEVTIDSDTNYIFFAFQIDPNNKRENFDGRNTTAYAVTGVGIVFVSNGKIVVSDQPGGECEQHSYTYIPSGEEIHYGICGECGDEITEACTYGDDTICDKCGYDEIEVDITLPEFNFVEGSTTYPAHEGIVVTSKTEGVSVYTGYYDWVVKVTTETGFSAEDVAYYENYSYDGWVAVRFMEDYAINLDHTYALAVYLDGEVYGVFGANGEYQGEIVGNVVPDYAYADGNYLNLYYIVSEPGGDEGDEGGEEGGGTPELGSITIDAYYSEIFDKIEDGQKLPDLSRLLDMGAISAEVQDKNYELIRVYAVDAKWYRASSADNYATIVEVEYDEVADTANNLYLIEVIVVSAPYMVDPNTFGLTSEGIHSGRDIYVNTNTSGWDYAIYEHQFFSLQTLEERNYFTVKFIPVSQGPDIPDGPDGPVESDGVVVELGDDWITRSGNTVTINVPNGEKYMLGIIKHAEDESNDSEYYSEYYNGFIGQQILTPDNWQYVDSPCSVGIDGGEIDGDYVYVGVEELSTSNGTPIVLNITEDQSIFLFHVSNTPFLTDSTGYKMYAILGVHAAEYLCDSNVPSGPAIDISDDLGLTVVGNTYTVDAGEYQLADGHSWAYVIDGADPLSDYLWSPSGIGEVPSGTYDASSWNKLDANNSCTYADANQWSVMLCCDVDENGRVVAYAWLPLADAEPGEGPDTYVITLDATGLKNCDAAGIMFNPQGTPIENYDYSLTVESGSTVTGRLAANTDSAVVYVIPEYPLAYQNLVVTVNGRTIERTFDLYNGFVYYIDEFTEDSTITIVGEATAREYESFDATLLQSATFDDITDGEPLPNLDAVIESAWITIKGGDMLHASYDLLLKAQWLCAPINSDVAPYEVDHAEADTSAYEYFIQITFPIIGTVFEVDEEAMTSDSIHIMNEEGVAYAVESFGFKGMEGTDNRDLLIAVVKPASGEPDTPHEHEHSYTYTSNTDGTHDGACECGEDAIVNQACTYVNDKCEKCGAFKPVISPVTPPVHTHSYTYTSNNDGTHNGTCECGEDAIVNQACIYVDGECYRCGYSEPVTPPAHEHSYTYTSNNNGTHNGTCECGEDAIVNEACAYVNGMCDKCGYAEPITPPAPPAVNVPISNNENKVDVEAEISGNDATVKPLDEEQINKLVGSENASGDVVIDLSKLDESIDTAGIPKTLSKLSLKRQRMPATRPSISLSSSQPQS